MATWLNVCWLRSFAAVVVGVGTILTCVQGARAQVTYELFHAFPGTRSGSLFVPASPGPLMQASDGHFYGTTVSDGASFCGSVYTITAAGDLATLHFFNGLTEGCSPFARLIQARDGTATFYGTTSSGGTGGTGTVFKITPDGLTTTLHSFTSDCAGGCFPTAGLIQAFDGTFYGTTVGGGAAEGGTVFNITDAGSFATVHSFDCGTPSSAGCRPGGGIIQTSDGTLYGTTESGGSLDGGSVFKITPAGAVTSLHPFNCFTDGCSPRAGLIQALRALATSPRCIPSPSPSSKATAGPRPVLSRAARATSTARSRAAAPGGVLAPSSRSLLLAPSPRCTSSPATAPRVSSPTPSTAASCRPARARSTATRHSAAQAQSSGDSCFASSAA